MKISMPRGDIKLVTFDVTDPETYDESEVEISEVYFTVKKKYSDESFLFQKKLSEGTIERVEGNKFQFVIESEDTDNLRFGTYVFDIQLVGPGLKTTTTGELELTYEVTYATNE